MLTKFKTAAFCVGIIPHRLAHPPKARTDTSASTRSEACTSPTKVPDSTVPKRKVSVRKAKTARTLWARARAKRQDIADGIIEAGIDLNEISAETLERERERVHLARKKAAERVAFRNAQRKGCKDLGLVISNAAHVQKQTDELVEVRFWSACLQYFSDNVLVMIAAATGGIGMGTVGTVEWTPEPPAKLGIQGVSVVINLFLMLGLRKFLQRVWKTASMTSPLRAVAFHAISDLLPWMPRVVGSNFMTALNSVFQDSLGYNTALASGTASDIQAARGKVFGMLVLVFLASFTICHQLRILTTKGDHSYGPDASILHYLIQVGFGCMSTMAGKSLLYMLDLLTTALSPVLAAARQTDHSNGQYWAILVLAQLLQSILSAWLLGNIIPRITRGSKSVFQLAQAQTLGYVIAYWWAFSIVDKAWSIFSYADDGDGLVPNTLMFTMWWLLLALSCATAFAIARLWIGPPRFDFNASTAGKKGLRTTLLMLGWFVNFVAWWAWAQILVYIPIMYTAPASKVDDGTYVFLVILVELIQQLLIFAALVAFVGLVNYLNSQMIVVFVEGTPDFDNALRKEKIKIKTKAAAQSKQASGCSSQSTACLPVTQQTVSFAAESSTVPSRRFAEQSVSVFGRVS